MAYELKQSDIYGFAHSIGAEYKEKGKELFFKYCPYCNGGQSRDKDTFSINMENGTFKCFRATCGKQGHFVELCRDKGYQLEFNKQSKQYRKLPQRAITIRDNAMTFLKSRGISETTGRRYNVTTQERNPNIITFPFFDENNLLQFVKYRNSQYNGYGNKEWCEKDTKPILFGMAQCTDFSTLVVTEGQLDSLSVADCGIKNVVSVPTGAKGFTWVEHCYDWVNKFNEIIIFGDCEHGKITLVNEFNLKFPNKKIKVVPMECYLGEKDANAILQKFGKDAIIKAISSAKDIPVSAVLELADVQNVDLYNMERVSTGISTLDRTLGGLYFGQVILLTGERGHGKSTFMSMLGCEALNQGYTCLFYSGELPAYQFKNWLNMQLAGANHLDECKSQLGDTYYKIPNNVDTQISEWYRGRALICDNNHIGDDELTTLENVIINTICRRNARFICIDNLMTAMDCDINSDLYRKQSSFVKSLKSIANKYNVCIILVAHPRKSSTQGKEKFQNDDISGSADITNRVDVVMVCSRTQEDKNGVKPKWDNELIITKNRLTGKLIYPKNAIKLEYSPVSKRLVLFDTNSPKIYNWENTQPPEYQEPPF